MKSWEATRWAKTLITAPNGEAITRSEKLVLQIIADYHNAEFGYAWAPVDMLAANALFSRRQTIRILNRLEHKRLVRIERHRGGTNRYFINHPRLDAPSTTTHWKDEDLWLKKFLDSPACFFIPLAALDDPAWWESVAVACRGISPRFIQQSFAKMHAYVLECPDKKPGGVPSEWKDFVRRWLCRENEWHQATGGAENRANGHH